ncbi:MAG: glycerate kinase [Bifidobacterium sp.]|jgi:glycerate kinase|nr:glycerate kinase [Bifidobacterium sp.]MCH4175533.1 glycerate kinase [Bifidobacterium sp.]
MKILIAPDSFKGSLSAHQAAEAISRGIHRALPSATCVLIPLADGGEGTVSALLNQPLQYSGTTSLSHSVSDEATPQMVTVRVTGPLGNHVDAEYAFLDSDRTAIMEMASASGLQYVDSTTMNPLLATSYGTGEMIRDALDRGAQTIILGLGGSASNDGGAGMAQALGVHLLDSNAHELHWGGAALASLSTIDLKDVDERLSSVNILLASDVDNPLTGRHGASAVFGPQKGATHDMVDTLDRAMCHYADIIRTQLHQDIANIPGSGAAGGLGAGCLAFTNASIHSGIDMVIQHLHVTEHAVDADYCFVGEGRIDAQTSRGKAPVGVAKAVKSVAPACKVIAVGGAIGNDVNSLYEQGIDAIFSISPGAISLDCAMNTAAHHLERCCENIMRAVM